MSMSVHIRKASLSHTTLKLIIIQDEKDHKNIKTLPHNIIDYCTFFLTFIHFQLHHSITLCFSQIYSHWDHNDKKFYHITQLYLIKIEEIQPSQLYIR